MLQISFIPLCTVIVVVCLLNIVVATDLDNYVWTPDENYGWTYMGEENDLHGKSITGRHSWTGKVLNYTSQRWLTDDEFTEDSAAKSIWWHYLIVFIPDDVQYQANATLYITGGSVTDGIPDEKSEDVILAASLAMGTKTITGALFQIPNEKMTFSSDPTQSSRTEGAILAYAWDQFLRDPSKPEWICEFAMTKASVLAMDAMTEYVATLPGDYALESFIVTGASKRGWATWLVGATDKLGRVKAIMPVVLDAINFAAVEHHQFRAYGGWSFALEDYYKMDIMTRYDSENMVKLQENIDAYWYRDRLTMPKLVVNAVLDEFQQPDDTDYWWNDMPEPKHFLMTPNADHSEASGLLEIIPAMGTWANYQLKNHRVPSFTWTISNTTGEIVATLDGEGEVYEASMWYAYSCGNNSDGLPRRDFRLASLDEPCGCGIFADGYCINRKSWWTQVKLEPTLVLGKRTYTAHMEAPADGRYVAYLIDVKYREQLRHNDEFPFDSNAKSVSTKMEKYGISHTSRTDRGDHRIPDFPWDLPGRLEFTTQVSIWPQNFPYEDCYMETCEGVLV